MKNAIRVNLLEDDGSSFPAVIFCHNITSILECSDLHKDESLSGCFICLKDGDNENFKVKESLDELYQIINS